MTQQVCFKMSRWTKKGQPGSCQQQDMQPKKPQIKRGHLFPKFKSQPSDLGKENTKTEPPTEEPKEIPSPSGVRSGLKRKRSGTDWLGDAEQPPCKRLKKEHSEFAPEMPKSSRKFAVLQAKGSLASAVKKGSRRRTKKVRQSAKPLFKLLSITVNSTGETTSSHFLGF
ncbi:hypothetical protein Q7C36_011897 [Tachysurus vachellii]|uniref:Uncharacterized protein n=1 Tax=Tachysurus vachellii TaxID=175792 RepID=A0AA88MWI0_TACVA|nr:hypothetical protein Q7C36_011897 [Tachysurus vachellii]